MANGRFLGALKSAVAVIWLVVPLLACSGGRPTADGGCPAGVGVASASGATGGPECGPDDGCGLLAQPNPSGMVQDDFCSTSCAGTPAWYCGCKGADAGAPSCDLDGGTPSFAGDWTGCALGQSVFPDGGATTTAAFNDDDETVAASSCGITFQGFLSSKNAMLESCEVSFHQTSPTAADLVPGTTCMDQWGDSFTFDCGTATMEPSGCAMTVLASGTGTNLQRGCGLNGCPDAAPKVYPVTFTTTLTLYRR